MRKPNANAATAYGIRRGLTSVSNLSCMLKHHYLLPPATSATHPTTAPVAVSIRRRLPLRLSSRPPLMRRVRTNLSRLGRSRIARGPTASFAPSLANGSLRAYLRAFRNAAGSIPCTRISLSRER
jgi:hypothetical protein